MNRELMRRDGVDKTERIRLSGHFYRKARFFAAFLICAALMVAGFGVSGVWLSREMRAPQAGGIATTAPAGSGTPPLAKPTPVPLPAGAIPIRDADLSAHALGNGYINNETNFYASLDALLARDCSSPRTAEPLVLVLHTHTSEGYTAAGATHIEGEIGDATYTDDPFQSVLAVGQAFTQALNEKGVTAIHCTVTHDGPTLGGSYARAAESIRSALEMYPSIRYVVDLHRDSVLNGDGEYLRAVCEIGGERCAQVMAVVGGAAANGARTEGNLALAQQLRVRLNADSPRLCRPTMIKDAGYSQDIAPYSLLLEIGTGGNSVEEACSAARLVGEALAEIICGEGK